MKNLPEVYNEKGFLSPDDIHSMASYHAKLYPVDKTGISSYQFRIGDCYQVISLRGSLTTEEEFNVAINKIENLEKAALVFKNHLSFQKNLLYNNPPQGVIEFEEDEWVMTDKELEIAKNNLINEMDEAIIDKSLSNENKALISSHPICYGAFIEGEWECKHCSFSVNCKMEG
jgi:hypothetical protein